MKEDIQTYKFNFYAEIGQFVLNANVSSPLTATWKRSNQSIGSTPVEMQGGKVNFGQTLKLPVNMYFEKVNQTFQQKKVQIQNMKSMISFAMNTPKGEKQAGVIYIQLSQVLNKKLQLLEQWFALQKCPVKDSKVYVKIRSEFVGEKDNDNMSLDSSMMGSGVSTLSIQSIKKLPNPNDKLNNPNEKQTKVQHVSVDLEKQKDTRISQLEMKLKKVTSEKEQVVKQLSELKKQRQQNAYVVKDSSEQSTLLRDELLKSKAIQNKLENELNNIRVENIEHERQLQKMRLKMEQVYEVLCNNLNTLY